jgi:thioredoxin-like negative regulator of GroEL
MKRIFYLLIAVFMVSGVNAQIAFEHLTLAEAVAKAKKENKPVFVDVHAVWCGPCKRMAATAFNDAKVTELYNKSFINVKIDGEKGDGPSVMQQYGITAYPTLLYINPDGTLARKQTGMMDAAQLISRANEALHPEESAVYKARKAFHASDRGRDALNAYVLQLATEQGDSLDHYTKLYFQQYTDLNFQDQVEFYVFYQEDKNIESANSAYFLTHPTDFTKDTYVGKIKQWIDFAFSIAVQQQDFSIVEAMVKKVYPYWEKSEALTQTQDEYLAYVRMQYDRYVPQ